MTNTPKNCLMLMDGNAVFHRAFHALPDTMTTRTGVRTNAVYGFTTTLLKALKDLRPKYAAVAFDMKGPTFRHAKYDGYKAHRAATAQELVDQIPVIHEVVKAFNIPTYEQAGFEADDIIGTLAIQAQAKKIPVVIVTGDNDAFQLVADDEIYVYTMRRGLSDTVLMNEAAVVAKMGVHPEAITDYKALAGDTSDEIPGVPGIGPKTAVQLIVAKGNLDAIVAAAKRGEAIPGVSPNVVKKISDNLESLHMSHELGTIRRDVPIALDLEQSLVHNFDPNKVVDLFKRLEFYSLIDRLPIAPAKPRDWRYDVVTTASELHELVAKLQKCTRIVVDTETDDLHGPVIGVSIAADRNHGYYVPLIAEHGAGMAVDEIIDILKPLLENDKIGKIGHNIKYDLEALQRAGVNLGPIVGDTMIASYVLAAHLRNHDLDSLALRELDYDMISFDSLFPPRTKSPSLVHVAADKVAEYAAEDAVITWRLNEKLATKLKQDSKLKTVYGHIDVPLIPVLATMERNGVLIDQAILKSLHATLVRRIDGVKTKILKASSNPDLNLNSPAQLQVFLFDDLKLPKDSIKTTKNGISTAAGELDKLKNLHPVVNKILEYRELTKLLNTYVETLPKLIAHDGRIHAQFNQTVAATGRLSSSDPNMQNIPIHSDLGNEIRRAFIAPKKNVILSLDYSQIELRIIAHITGDPQLQAVFKSGRDIHSEVAERLHVDRRAAKAINFGIFYGLSSYGLSQSLGIDPKQAKQYIDAYLATYPKVREYIASTKNLLRRQGYVETLFGRRREIPEITSSNAMLRAAAERMAVNMPAQGTQADLVKLAMIRVQKWLDHEFADASTRPKMLIQVHDELVFEVPANNLNAVAYHIKSIMEGVMKLDVPLVADAASGPNWGDLKPLKL